LKGSV